MTTKKEGTRSPDQAAPQAISTADSTAPETPRALYNPLTWRPEKPARFRGKGKRRTRFDAIARKGGEYGHAHAGLLAWLAATAALWILAEGAR